VQTRHKTRRGPQTRQVRREEMVEIRSTGESQKTQVGVRRQRGSADTGRATMMVRAGKKDMSHRRYWASPKERTDKRGEKSKKKKRSSLLREKAKAPGER